MRDKPHTEFGWLALAVYIEERYLNMFDPREKIALFIDGANLYATSKALGFDIDYNQLLVYFQEKGYFRSEERRVG